MTEITRLVANRVGGRANYLFAPALPGPELYQSLLKDPSIQKVLHLWPHARCALMGVGAGYAALANARPAEAAAITSSQTQVEQGKRLYLEGCSSCHGMQAQGTTQGPTLVGVGAAAVDFQVSSGRMPMAAPGAQAIMGNLSYLGANLTAGSSTVRVVEAAAVVLARRHQSRMAALQDLVGSFSHSPAEILGVILNEH